jgi:hypothetical protein
MKEPIKEKLLNTAIDHLKKSPVLQEVRNAADSLLDHLNDTFKHDPISLADLVTKFSDSTDQLIIETEQNENLEFIGGELTARLQPQKEQKLSLILKLYFKNQKGSFVLKESEKQISQNVLTSESLEELNIQEQTFEVDDPLRRI